MRKSILVCLCNAAILAVLCLPAQARMIVGLTPTTPLSGIDQTTTNQLGSELTAAAGTTVKIRRFDNTAAISNWLLRFQEIDAAVVAPAFIKQQPAGALQYLVDLHTKSNSSSPLALVVRNNLSSSQATQIKDAFLKLNVSDSGRQTLEKLGLIGVSLPGEPFKRKAAKPAPPLTQSVKDKTVLPAPEIVQPEAPQAQPKVTATTRPSGEKPLSPAMPIEPPAEKQAVAAKTSPERLAKTSSKPEPVAESSQEPTIQEPAKAEQPVKPAEASEAAEVTPQTNRQEPPPKPAPNKRLLLFVALILLLAILLKACLFARRWQSKKRSSFSSEEAPAIGTAFERTDVALPIVAQETSSEEEEEELVIEAGNLGPGKVPALLKRCADLPRPVVLKVCKGSCEKLVYFAGGQVSGALTQNAANSESGVRWSKLGNLLVREELITSEERDQGMALLIKEPGLRFGEALLKLGLIDLIGLRHALTRQAKVTIYSLILFPEGRYQVFAGDGSLPPEESVSLGVTSLIREASHHQSEWTAIRQALPNLNTALDFTPDGRSKLDKVSISSQQEATLSLIDGKHTINDLCIESSMMDYEVYRFLYLMVKAGVLK